jgi:hypothetical protein
MPLRSYTYIVAAAFVANGVNEGSCQYVFFCLVEDAPVTYSLISLFSLSDMVVEWMDINEREQERERERENFPRRFPLFHP